LKKFKEKIAIKVATGTLKLSKDFAPICSFIDVLKNVKRGHWR